MYGWLSELAPATRLQVQIPDAIRMSRKWGGHIGIASSQFVRRVATIRASPSRFGGSVRGRLGGSVRFWVKRLLLARRLADLGVDARRAERFRQRAPSKPANNQRHRYQHGALPPASRSDPRTTRPSLCETHSVSICETHSVSRCPPKRGNSTGSQSLRHLVYCPRAQIRLRNRQH